MNPAFRSLKSILPALDSENQERLMRLLDADSGDPATMADRIVDPRYVRQVVSNASPDAITALKTWVAQGGMWHETWDRGRRLEQGIQELAATGWIFDTTYDGHYPLYVMPSELLPRLLPVLWDIPFDQIVQTVAPRSDGPAPVWEPFTHDIFQVLSFARHETLLLTNQHEVYRRYKAKIEKLLWPRSDLPPTSLVDHLVPLMARLGFFDVHDTPFRYEISDDALAWIELASPASWQYLAEFLFDPSRLSWPTLVWVSLAAALSPNQALMVAETAHWMEQAGLSSVHERYLLNQAVMDLRLCGVWEMAGPKAIRLTASTYSALQGQFEAEERQTSFAQPNGDIVVPPTVPMVERWAIDGLATRVNSERVQTYRVDVEAVRWGVRRGLDAPSHAASLEKVLRARLPDNVRTNLDDWYRQISRHRILDVTLIHSGDAGSSRDAESILGPDVIQRLSATDIVIGRDRVKEAVKKLERAGNPILPDVLRLSEVEQESAPVNPYHRRRAWPVRVWQRTSQFDRQPVQNLRELLAAALRQGRSVRLAYVPAGETQPHTELVFPVALESHWVQVYVIHQRRYILIDWKQVLAAEVESSPV